MLMYSPMKAYVIFSVLVLYILHVVKEIVHVAFEKDFRLKYWLFSDQS